MPIFVLLSVFIFATYGAYEQIKFGGILSTDPLSALTRSRTKNPSFIHTIGLELCYNYHMEYENYIWDLGGTLLDNYESSSRAFSAALWAKAERVFLHEDIYDALKISTACAVETFASDIPDFLSFYKQLEAETLKQPILFKGAEKVLSELTASDCKNFMISHRNYQVMAILARAGIDQFFTEVVSSDNGFKRKPAPDSILYLCQKYQLNPQKTVMIGDRPLDIEAGNAAGVASVFFDATKRNLDASQSIKSLLDLLD